MPPPPSATIGCRGRRRVTSHRKALPTAVQLSACSGSSADWKRVSCPHAIRSRPGAFRRRRALSAFTELENLDRIADGLATQGWTVVDDFFGHELTAALRGDCRTS